MSNKTKIVLFDTETSPSKGYFWDPASRYIPPDRLIEDWRIFCAAWKVLDSPRVEGVTCFERGKKKDDYNVVKTMRDAFEDVDILIGHNAIEFDIKKLTTRLIYHNLPPLPKIVVIDTLKAIKQIAASTYNNLDYLSKFFGYEGKTPTGFGLWKAVDKGDEDSMTKMFEYCKNDVTQLEKVYLRLRPYLLNHPVIADILTHNCPKCNSPNVRKHKNRMSAQGIWRRQWCCSSCGSYFTERTSLKEKSFSK